MFDIYADFDSGVLIMGNSATNYFIKNNYLDERFDTLFFTELGRKTVLLNYPTAKQVCVSLDKDSCTFENGDCIGNCVKLKVIN